MSLVEFRERPPQKMNGLKQKSILDIGHERQVVQRIVVCIAVSTSFSPLPHFVFSPRSLIWHWPRFWEGTVRHGCCLEHCSLLLKAHFWPLFHPRLVEQIGGCAKRKKVSKKKKMYRSVVSLATGTSFSSLPHFVFPPRLPIWHWPQFWVGSVR